MAKSQRGMRFVILTELFSSANVPGEPLLQGLLLRMGGRNWPYLLLGFSVSKMKISEVRRVKELLK